MRIHLWTSLCVLVTAFGVSGCSSSSDAESNGAPLERRLQAEPETATALGVTDWILKGNGDRTTFYGVRRANDHEDVVVEGAISQDHDRIYFDFQRPTPWHADWERKTRPSQRLPFADFKAFLHLAHDILRPTPAAASGLSVKPRTEDLLSGAKEPLVGPGNVLLKAGCYLVRIQYETAAEEWWRKGASVITESTDFWCFNEDNVELGTLWPGEVLERIPGT